MKVKDRLGGVGPVQAIRRGHGIDSAQRPVPIVAGPPDGFESALRIRIERVLEGGFPMTHAVVMFVSDYDIVIARAHDLVEPQVRTIPVDSIERGRIQHDVPGRPALGHGPAGLSSVPGLEQPIVLVINHRAPRTSRRLPRFDFAEHRVFRMLLRRMKSTNDVVKQLHLLEIGKKLWRVADFANLAGLCAGPTAPRKKEGSSASHDATGTACFVAPPFLICTASNDGRRQFRRPSDMA